MIYQIFELSTGQSSIVKSCFSLVTVLSFIGVSSLASEVPTVAYKPAEALEERRLHVEKTCAKYNDNLKYEYRALHDVPRF